MTVSNPDWFADVLARWYPDTGGYVQIAFSPEFTMALTEVNAYPDSVIYSVLLALAKFNSHVQYCENHFAAELLGKKRYFERKKRETISSLDVPKSTTEKAKLDAAYANNPDLQILEDELVELEKNVKLYESMPDRIHEMIQVIKREIDRRGHQR